MATDSSEFLGSETARATLVESEHAMRDLLIVMHALRDRVMAEGDVSQPEVAKTVTTLAAARSRLNEDIAKYEDRVLFDKKRVAHAPLDFEKLRAELGSKIDRIRAAMEAGEVPERADN